MRFSDVAPSVSDDAVESSLRVTVSKPSLDVLAGFPARRRIEEDRFAQRAKEEEQVAAVAASLFDRVIRKQQLFCLVSLNFDRPVVPREVCPTR